MAAAAWKVYGSAVLAINKGDLDLDSGIRMVLVTSSYTPDQSADDTWSDVSTNEVADGGGYSTHGKAVTMSNTRSSLVTTIDCDDQTWTTSTITAKYAVLVKDANADNALAGTDQLIAYCDLNDGGGSLSSTSADFAVSINASGIFTATAS